MTKEQLEILQHSLGADQYGCREKYCDRNYYIGEDAIANELVGMGMMNKFSGNVATGWEPCYRVTDAGIKAMRDNSPVPPKVTRSQQRYRDWLRSDGCIADMFGEYLKAIQQPWYKEMMGKS